MNIDWEALRAPFPSEEVKWRVGSTTKDKRKGLALAYIDSRAVMDRLDSICRPHRWGRRHEFGPGGEIVCSIGIKCAQGASSESEWVWKTDGASATDFEAVKGGLSDSFKRAAVSWGIGRYLYQLEGIWCPIEQKGRSYYLKETPSLPRWALPTDEIKDRISADEVDEIYTLAKEYGWDKSKTRRNIYQKFNCLPEQLKSEEAITIMKGLSQ